MDQSHRPNGIDIAHEFIRISKKHNIAGETHASKMRDFVDPLIINQLDNETKLIAYIELTDTLKPHLHKKQSKNQFEKKKKTYFTAYNTRHDARLILSFLYYFNIEAFSKPPSTGQLPEFIPFKKIPKLFNTEACCVEIFNNYLSHKDLTKSANEFQLLFSQSEHKINDSINNPIGKKNLISSVLVDNIENIIFSNNKFIKNKAETETLFNLFYDAAFDRKKMHTDGRWLYNEEIPVIEALKASLDYTNKTMVVTNFCAILNSDIVDITGSNPSYHDDLNLWIDTHGKYLKQDTAADIYLQLDNKIKETEKINIDIGTCPTIEKSLHAFYSTQKQLICNLNPSVFSSTNRFLSLIIKSKENTKLTSSSISRLLQYIPNLNILAPYSSKQFHKNEVVSAMLWCKDLIIESTPNQKVQSMISAMQPTFERQELVKLCNTIPQKTLKLAL